MTEQEYSVICQRIINGETERSACRTERARVQFRRMRERKNDLIGLVLKKRQQERQEQQQLRQEQQARQEQQVRQERPVALIRAVVREEAVSHQEAERSFFAAEIPPVVTETRPVATEIPPVDEEAKDFCASKKKIKIGGVPISSEQLLERVKALVASALETTPTPEWTKLAIEICKQELPAWRGDTKSTPADYKLVLDELIAPEPIRLQVLQRKEAI